MQVKYDRKLKFYHGLLYEPVYKTNIYLVWPCDTEIRSYYFDKYHGIVNDVPFTGFAGCSTYYIDEVPQGEVIQLSEWNGTPKHISWLAHECLHATFSVMNNRGIKLNNEDLGEAFCYLHEYLVRKCLEALKGREKK